jgi:hypothetical protein
MNKKILNTNFKKTAFHFQVRMLLIEHLFEYCSAKFYFQFTDCAGDVQPFVDDSLGDLIGKIGKAKVNQITNMVKIAGSANFKTSVSVRNKVIVHPITENSFTTVQVLYIHVGGSTLNEWVYQLDEQGCHLSLQRDPRDSTVFEIRMAELEECTVSQVRIFL